jgi:hypothetical protein
MKELHVTRHRKPHSAKYFRSASHTGRSHAGNLNLFVSYRRRNWTSNMCKVLRITVKATTFGISSHAWIVPFLSAYLKPGNAKYYNECTYGDNYYKVNDTEMNEMQICSVSLSNFLSNWPPPPSWIVVTYSPVCHSCSLYPSNHMFAYQRRKPIRRGNWFALYQILCTWWRK